MRSTDIRQATVLATVALLGVLGLAGCGTGSGTTSTIYQAQTPYLSDVAPYVQDCSGTYYVSDSVHGQPTLPFEVYLTSTVGNQLAVTITTPGSPPNSTLPVIHPGPAGVVPPYIDSWFEPSASIDATYPLVYNVIDIYPDSGTTFPPPQESATYAIAEMTGSNNQLESPPLTFAVQWGQMPPPGCWVAPKQPAPTNLNAVPAGSPTGTDFQLQFSSPAWRTGGNQSNQNSCSVPDTFDVQISSDPTFRLPARSINVASGPAGAPNYTVTGGTTDQTFNAANQWTLSCSWNGGNLKPNPQPLTLSFGAIDAPDVTYTNGAVNPLFFRVRGEYYGAIGPWSQPINFNVPPPTQNFNSGTDVCNFNTGLFSNAQFPCTPWNFQTNVPSWDLEASNSGTTFVDNANAAFASTLATSVVVAANSGPPACCGSFTGTGPPVNQYCPPAYNINNLISSLNTNPYCAWQPTIPGGPFLWAIRADYAGSTSEHLGPWAEFAGTWPLQVSVPNLIGETVSAAQTNIQNAGLKVCQETGPPAGTSGPFAVTAQTPPAGTSVSQGTCVNFTWGQAGGGGTSSFSTINVENCTSDGSAATVWYAATGSSWQSLGSFDSTCTINSTSSSLTSGQTYMVAAVSDSGASGNVSCNGLSPDQAGTQGASGCIISETSAPVLGGPGGAALFEITGSAPP